MLVISSAVLQIGTSGCCTSPVPLYTYKCTCTPVVRLWKPFTYTGTCYAAYWKVSKGKLIEANGAACRYKRRTFASAWFGPVPGRGVCRGNTSAGQPVQIDIATALASVSQVAIWNGSYEPSHVLLSVVALPCVGRRSPRCTVACATRTGSVVAFPFVSAEAG